jgi:two-component system OmpR family sensor kinase
MRPTDGIRTRRQDATRQWRLTSGEPSEHSDRAFRRRIVLRILFAGLFAAAAALHVTRSVSTPLVELAGRMHRLASKDTNIEVLETARRDEIGEMARAVVVFKNNAIDLAENRQALAHQASTIDQQDIRRTIDDAESKEPRDATSI